MNVAISIPDDISVVQLAKAMASIGLIATQAPGRMLTFERDPLRYASKCETDGCGLPFVAQCMVDGCAAPAGVKEGQATTCARHWLASRA